PFVLHTTDETVTEFAIEPYAANAPLHVVALRTPTAKYATYSDWPIEGVQPLTDGQERECYDYRTRDGRLELDNSAGHTPLEGSLHGLLQQAYAEELHRPLPPSLLAAHEQGFYDYFTVATRAAARAAQHRAEHVPTPTEERRDQKRTGGTPFLRIVAPGAEFCSAARARSRRPWRRALARRDRRAWI